MEKAYDKIVWENSPSTQTPLNATNLNEMSDALDTIDDRVIVLDSDKVDKVAGKGLSENDFTDEYKEKLDNASSVSVEQVVTQGTTLATITIDGTATDIVGSDIDVDDELSTESENPVQNKVIAEELNKKADSNEPIESAYSLAITTPIENEAVYMKRQIPVKNSFRERMSLVGATVNANQLVDTSTTSVTIPSGHKYIAKISGAWSIGASDGTAITVDGSNGDMLTDLTQWFGAAVIPDYAYSLEQATAGSGIAWLKSQGFFNEDYIGYKTGGLESVSAEEKINVGKNLFDIVGSTWSRDAVVDGYTIKKKLLASGETWTYCNNRSFRMDGNYTISVKMNGNKPRVFIRLRNLSNTAWLTNSDVTLSGWNYLAYYGGWYREVGSAYESVSGSFTKPANCSFFQIGVGADSGSNVGVGNNCIFSNIQIEFGSTATEYEPYHVETIPFDTTKTLRGLYSLDENNNIMANGDIYNADGTVTRNYREVDLGALDYAYSSNQTRFYAVIDNIVEPSSGAEIADIISEDYITESFSDLLNNGDNMVIAGYSQSGTNYITIRNTAYTNASTFKAAMSEHKILIKNETPTTESATPFIANQSIDPNGTEEFVDYGVTSGDRDFVVPVGSIAEFTQKVEIPSLPSENGEYAPKLTVSDSGSVWSWVANESSRGTKGGVTEEEPQEEPIEK